MLNIDLPSIGEILTKADFQEVRLMPYVAIFGGALLLFHVGFIVVGFFLPGLVQETGTALSIAAKIVSAQIAYMRFIRRNERLLDGSEYWTMVVSCTAVSAALEIVQLFLASAVGALPSQFNALTPTLIVFMVAISLAVSFAVVAAGYANWFGKHLLQAEMKRRSKS
jgi:hypothetical protein